MAYTKRVAPFSAIVAVIAFAFMFCLVILNRGSEKVVTTFLTAVAAIILAGMYSKDRPPDGTFSQKVAFWINNEKTATGLIVVFLALVLAVFVFGQQPTIKNTFPAMLCYQLRDRSYVQLSGFHDLAYDGGFYVEQLKAVRPDLFREATNIGDFEESGLLLYHQFLQREILQSMAFAYQGSWSPEILDLGSMQLTRPGEQIASRIYSPDEMAELMRGNPFGTLKAGIPLRLALPPGSRLHISGPSHRDKEGPEVGEITIEKPFFFTLSIKTERIIPIRGAGFYRMFSSSLYQRDPELASVTYAVTIKCTFAKWLADNPNMTQYHEWAEHLTQSLQEKFDERAIEKKTADSYILQKLLTLQTPQSP